MPVSDAAAARAARAKRCQNCVRRVGSILIDHRTTRPTTILHLAGTAENRSGSCFAALHGHGRPNEIRWSRVQLAIAMHNEGASLRPGHSAANPEISPVRTVGFLQAGV